MDRRTFVGGGLTGLVLTTTGSFAQPLALPESRRPPLRRLPVEPLQICRIRRDIRNITPAQLTALKTGISTMMARPISDPTSWAYQAAIHGSMVSPARPLWNSCEHGSLHFFSWHRLFLYYFERILRQASGSPTLTLPFWNWQAQRSLPMPFVDTTAGNPLFVSQRSSAMNSGGLLPSSAVNMGPSFATTNFSSFSSQIEGTPHGAVHVSVGGWMSAVRTAGQDPIFWLHHCNIDRLWERWLAQGGGRANPTDAAWRNRTFTFYDANGAQVTRKASDALATCGSLRYTYEVHRFMIDRLILARLLPLTFAVPAGVSAAAAAQQVTLAEPVTRAPISLAPVAARLGQGRILLSFEGIRVRDTEGYYEVYLNPSRREGLTASDPSYAGNLVFFGVPAEGETMTHAGHGQGSDRRIFDVTDKLRELRRRGLVGNDNLDVVLVLRLPEGGRRPVLPSRNLPRATINAVRVLAQ